MSDYPPPPGGYPSAPPPPEGQGGYGQQPGYGYGQPAGYQGGYAPAAYQQPGDYPIDVTFVRPDRQSRWLAAFSIPYFLIRLLLLIPHMFVLYFVQIGAFFVIWIGFWAVLFTGRYPQGMYDFAAGSLRWSTRVSAYLYGLTDKYPPFRLNH